MRGHHILSITPVGPLATVYTRASLRLRQAYATFTVLLLQQTQHVLGFCFFYQIDMYNYNVNHAISFMNS